MKVNISKSSFTVSHCDEELDLLPQRCVFLPLDKSLLVSDLHIGKSSHFRRQGIAVPKALMWADLYKLGELLNIMKPKTLYILGDLFHVTHVADTDLFTKWRKSYSEIEIILVRGNHDRLSEESIAGLGIQVKDVVKLRQLRLIHAPDRNPPGGILTIHGHIHPAVRVFGKGRQSVRLPCFHLRRETLTLPAFGEFTGCKIIEPEAGDKVFAVAKDEVSEKLVMIR